MPTIQQKTIKAKFLGQDRSLGYRTNKTYKLVVTKSPRIKFLGILLPKWLSNWALNPNLIIVMRENRLLNSYNWGYCPYSSMRTFLQNWEIKKGKLWK